MRIALIGYGKMGKTIETLCIGKHTISYKIGSGNVADINAITKENTDVAIEFTTPETAFSNIAFCINKGIPVISGSTGWLHRWEEIVQLCGERGGSFVYASNFSVGVNVFFELNRYLAAIMANLPQYDVRIHEIHHTQKKDAPSGTALSIKDRMKEGSGGLISEIKITSDRIDPAPGTHIVNYSSVTDDITLEHKAHSREGFAGGAIMAAEWIVGKKGVFSMGDIIESMLFNSSNNYH
jgi:4-hydroxy-tetrahydrodipicolinate reductase